MVLTFSDLFSSALNINKHILHIKNSHRGLQTMYKGFRLKKYYYRRLLVQSSLKK